MPEWELGNWGTDSVALPNDECSQYHCKRRIELLSRLRDERVHYQCRNVIREIDPFGPQLRDKHSRYHRRNGSRGVYPLGWLRDVYHRRNGSRGMDPLEWLGDVRSQRRNGCRSVEKLWCSKSLFPLGWCDHIFCLNSSFSLCFPR